jgi:small subunit ribosomal protein S20
MPQHKSAAKRVRQSAKRRERNRIHRSRMRTLIKKVQSESDKSRAEELLNETSAYLDRLATKRIIHPNKAANYKSALRKQVSAL